MSFNFCCYFFPPDNKASLASVCYDCLILQLLITAFIARYFEISKQNYNAASLASWMALCRPLSPLSLSLSLSHTHTHTNTHTYKDMQADTYTHTHTHTHIYIYIYAHTYREREKYLSQNIHIVHIQIHTHIYIYIYIYIYILDEADMQDIAGEAGTSS